MKKALAHISLLLILVFSLFACVPTPEQEIVHMKDESQMIEDAQHPIDENSTISDQVQAPYIWKKSTDTANFHIRASAPVIIPKCDAFPIYEIKTVSFTQEQVDIFWTRLVGDQEMYESQTDDSMLPKSHLAMLIQNEMDRIERLEHDEYYDENVQIAQDNIKYYQSLYQKAPDDWVYTPVTSEIRDIVRRSDTDVYHILGIDATGGNGMMFRLINDNYYEKNGRPPITNAQFLFKRSEYMNYSEYRKDTIPINQQATTSGKDGLAMPPQEAVVTANELILSIDETMEPDRVELYNTHPYNNSGIRYDHWCYAIIYHRSIEGCPVAIINGSTGGPYAVTPTWRYEQCAVLVDDQGIQCVKWDSPLAIGVCRVRSSKLLTFEEIEPLTETMLRYTYSSQAEGSDLTMNVTEVRLELMRTIQQDNITEGLLVPVWNFYGTRQRKFASDQFDDDETMNMLLVSLNAVTGNPIDLNIGY